MKVTRWSDGSPSLNELLFQEEQPCTPFFKFKPGAQWGIFIFYFIFYCPLHLLLRRMYKIQHKGN